MHCHKYGAAGAATGRSLDWGGGDFLLLVITLRQRLHTEQGPRQPPCGKVLKQAVVKLPFIGSMGQWAPGDWDLGSPHTAGVKRPLIAETPTAGIKEPFLASMQCL